MKINVILCCVACCLLSLFPENKGSKLKDSLYCFMQYSKKIITCSWSESERSRQFVHMSLMDINGSPVCDEMEPVQITPTHRNWKCHKILSVNSFLYQELHFIFLPDRSLESRLNVSNEGDEAKPKNLHCEVTGGIISCFWEVRQEVADSVDFTLYYQKASEKEEACQPRCWQKTPTYLSCACNFTADHKNSILLHNITVQPTDPETSKIVFKICKNIMLEPRILTVEERKEEETFEIGWKKQIEQNAHFKYKYELCYWREKDMKPNEDAVDCPGNTLSQNDNFRVLRLENPLEPGSNYSVKVRVRLGEIDPDECYKGPWSEWSNVQTFHTKSVVSTAVLFILVLSSVVFFVICAVCGYRAIVRYKKQWEDTIPNPSKSSIVKGLHKAKNGPSFPYEEHLYVEPYNNVLMQAPSKKDINLLEEGEEQVNWPHNELFWEDDSQCISLFKMTKEEYPAASPTEGYTPFSELVDEQENREMEDSRFTFSAFDGPYLLS
ncbi:cytokine receptor common subunit beta-like isoform X2 [Eleutherodactylus coqui]|uniref:cytokine receptor common subunit beta-like isoform X2 n=1 Tax=Eleutherodactylus coqui TaxID=57060 RepID=UPI003462D99B